MPTLNQRQLKAGSPMTALWTVAAILLLVVFAVGCSEQSLSPLSSDAASTASQAPALTEREQERLDDPLPKKPPSSSDATFRVTFSGDISGGPEERTQQMQPSSTQVVISKPGIALDLAYFQTALAGGGVCFSAGEFTGPFQIKTKKKNTPSLAESFFFFSATGSGGVTEIKYVMTMNGQFTDPTNWPPAVGTQNTAIMTDWELTTEGGGQNRKVSCTGEGIFGSGVTILVERIS